MIVKAAGLSDTGLIREHNEDSFCILKEFDLFAVADGMGGHLAGDVASRIATESIAEFFRATAGEDATWPFHFDPHLSTEENRLMTGIKVANRQIFDAAAKDRSMHQMGTTIVGALFARAKNKIYVAHVGDSRCYRVRDRQIEQLTRDHSLYYDSLLLMPDMPDDQREELPKNVITRALGMHDSVVVDMRPDEPRLGDRYILCSDGLSGMISDADICEVIAESGSNLDGAAKKLIERANAAGGEDNCTVIILAIENE